MIHDEICTYEVCKLAKERDRLLAEIEQLKKERAELQAEMEDYSN